MKKVLFAALCLCFGGFLAACGPKAPETEGTTPAEGEGATTEVEEGEGSTTEVEETTEETGETEEEAAPEG